MPAGSDCSSMNSTSSSLMASSTEALGHFLLAVVEMEVEGPGFEVVTASNSFRA